MDFRSTEKQLAIELWNKLALSNNRSLTIAYNPLLYDFYADYLKLSPLYFILSMDGMPIGLLPLVNTGKTLISMPHFSSGGIHWLEEVDKTPYEEADLIQTIVDASLSKNLTPGFYEINFNSSFSYIKTKHQAVEVRSNRQFFSYSDQSKVIHLMLLKQTTEEQLSAFSSNLRRKINKASKNQLQLKSGQLELLDDFSKVYNENMHRIGSPTLGKKFFGALLQNQSENAKLFVVYMKDKPIGGSFSMWYNGYYENTWFSTLSEFNHLYPSYMLHVGMINEAISKKMHTYSMGRSTKGGGVQRFKLQWPVEEKTLFFNSNTKPGFSLKNQKWLTQIWKRLPAGLVNSLGPSVAKRLY